MKTRNPIHPVEVRTPSPEQIVGRSLVILFAIVGFIDFVTMGAMWK